jgi:hypothetical protein
VLENVEVSGVRELLVAVDVVTAGVVVVGS